jgi:predicted nuclease of predicted toxin-antitoxin system
VKLLFDQNLSYHLVRLLADVYPDSGHVRPLGLDKTDDLEIWKFAAREGFTVVSKDADYQQLGMLLGPPPKVIWIRLGNCQAEALETLLRQALPAIQEFHADPGLAVLSLPLQLLP